MTPPHQKCKKRISTKLYPIQPLSNPLENNMNTGNPQTNEKSPEIEIIKNMCMILKESKENYKIQNPITPMSFIEVGTNMNAKTTEN